jgi:anaerobic selenocysteine-containing dehydrogenase
MFEDLGVQMNLHSTLCSYLEKLLWLLTGNFANPGGQYVPTSIVNLAGSSGSGSRSSGGRRTPVANALIISGLVPCNVIAEEILTDHPDRYRAMLVESANPAHSLADGPRMRDALEALEFVVVIDVAMTETAQLADYVLPAASQFEKAESTFFNFEFPHNYFHLRHPVVDPLPGTLPEPEIHARIIEALGALDHVDLRPLADAAREGRDAFGAKSLELMGEHPELGALASVVLYRTLGPTLPAGLESAALLWGAAQRSALEHRPSIERAGIEGEGTALGDALFDAILTSPSGVTFSVDEHADSWARVRTPGGQLHLANDILIEELTALATEQPPGGDPEFPLVLTAGERRSFTANTIIRDPAWRKRDASGALRVSEADATALRLSDGDTALLTTKRGSAKVLIEISPMMRPGHVALPNGLGLTHTPDGERVGVAPNELTSSEDRDPIAGTPYHKHVPARLEPIAS